MNANKFTIQSGFLTIFVVFVLISLAFRRVELSWTIVTIAIIYGLRKSFKYGKNWLRGRKSKVAKKERFLLFLVSMMLLFLATGSALFLWAFQLEHEDSIIKPDNREWFIFTNAEYLLRSLVCSFQLFAASIDSNVLDEIKGHEYVKGLISLQAILSFACTIAILISLAYARVRAYIKLHKQTTIDESQNHLYVFFGMNDPSKLLAKSIKAKEGNRGVVLFVENNQVNEDNQNGWDSIVGLFTHRRQTFSEADSLDARVTFTETRLCDVDIEDINDNDLGKKDVLKEINLIKLKELICKLKDCPANAELHIFFLSTNEDENIQAMSVLARDATINEVNNCIIQKFYCHARQNGLNRVVEDIAVKRGLDVRIIDSSHLSIELLKANQDYHPVKLVDIDKDNPTTVSSEFNSLVIGFDEAGQDAMKFLYEFGAFVSNEGTPENEIRSPFHCIAADKRMNELQGVFSTFAPAAIAQKNSDGTKLIELVQCDCLSSEFFDNVLDKDLRQKLNYVVITLGDDDLGMMLAIRILSHIRREREDLSRLRIFVRSYRPERESYMQKIANYYNEGYNQDCSESKKPAYQTEAIIIPFGQSEKIYSYDMIIRDKLTQQGKLFQKHYCEMKGEKEFWNLRRDLLTGAKKRIKNEDGKKVIVEVPVGERKVSLNDMRSLRRKESQDLANALHLNTKMYLLTKSLGTDYNDTTFLKNYFGENGKPKCEGGYDKIRYPYLSVKENQAILNLARLEHLRWNASHEMLGYTKADTDVHGCNERTRQHNCLRPWEELDDEGKTVSQLEGWKADYKSFDFGVVDVSIWINQGMNYENK